MMAQCFSGMLIVSCRITNCRNRETKDNFFFCDFIWEVKW